MIVLYISFEPYGPAMLEAALIDKYSSAFVAKRIYMAKIGHECLHSVFEQNNDVRHPTPTAAHALSIL